MLLLFLPHSSQFVYMYYKPMYDSKSMGLQKEVAYENLLCQNNVSLPVSFQVCFKQFVYYKTNMIWNSWVWVCMCRLRNDVFQCALAVLQCLLPVNPQFYCQLSSFTTWRSSKSEILFYTIFYKDLQLLTTVSVRFFLLPIKLLFWDE
jgi:hypothetical protein